MFKITNKNIQITRGDCLLMSVSALDSEGNDYTFQTDDVIRITIYKDKEYSSIVFQKDFTVTEETTSVDIELTSSETRIGDAINETVAYCYEIELNPDTEYAQTIIGTTRSYDEDTPKYFYLIPETYEVSDD